VIAKVKAAYYEYALRHRVSEVWRKNLRLLGTFAETAESLYRVGTGIQADVLRAQTEISRLQETIELAEQRKVAAAAQINALLDRPTETALTPPAPFERARADISFDELLKLAQDRFPMLRRQGESVEANQLSLRLAEKEKYPDLGVMVAYHNRGGLKDLWEIGGMVRIPIYFRRKQNVQIEEATARLEASQATYQDLRAAMEFELKDRYLEAKTSERLLALLQETVIPQETLTLEASSASYQVGKADFLSVLDSLLKLTSDEIRYYEHLTTYQKALAAMEPMVGMELTGR
jgi:outer membrane protein TolC